MISQLSFSLLAVAAYASAAARPEMLVNSEWLSSHLTDPKIVILHVSADRKAYDAGHIPGARFVSLGDIADDGAVTVRDFAILEAKIPPPISIQPSSQPPKISPFWLVSAGIASVRIDRSPQGSISAIGGA